MSIIVRRILALLIFAMSAYLIGAFVLFQPDPSAWTTEARFLAVVIVLVVYGLYYPSITRDTQ